MLTLAVVEGAVIFCAASVGFLFVDRAHSSSDPVTVVAQALTLTACGLFAFHFNDLYDLRRSRGFRQLAARLPRALMMMILLLAVVESLVPGRRTSWRSLVETVVIVAVLLLLLRATVHYLFAARPFSRRVLVLGTTELAGKLVGEMLSEPGLRNVVVGVADDGSAAFRPALPCLLVGSIESLGKIIEGFGPDLIVCALPDGYEPLLMRELLPSLARGVPVEDGLAAYERLTGKVAIEHATPRAVLFSRDFEASGIALVVARVLSVIVGSCCIVVLSPFLVPVVLLIKLDSEGPVFFLHERVGLGGRPFNLIKFRTMRPGGAASEWAVDNEHRTTRVGRWLRRFRIDELPQLLNVLRGEMNLVGPRPHPLSNLALFTENIPYYSIRWSVRPGVTGWAQIRYGYANDLKTETEKMRYDLHYIKHASLGLDLRILLETLTVVLKGGRCPAPVNEPGLQVSPVYFGIDHQKTARGVARFSEQRGLRAAPSGPLALVGPTAGEAVSTADIGSGDVGTEGPREPSPGACTAVPRPWVDLGP